MEDKLLYKDLTYQIRGILFEVHNELGRMLNEKQYADAVEHKLIVKKIKYQREKVLDKSFVGERSNRNRIDFIIEDKIILEIKAVSFLSKDDYFQCQRYLVSFNKELALLVNFRTKLLTIKRVLNHQQYNNSHL